ncbi:hypothetical protein AAG906_039527 [Vitis piasezkii]
MSHIRREIQYFDDVAIAQCPQAYSLIVQKRCNDKFLPRGNPRLKMCDHCNRSGHTIDECRTLKFHCKFCDKRGHTEDRCRLKNGSNNKTGQFRGQRPFGRGITSRTPGFTTKQIQQLAQAIRATDHIVSHKSLFTDLKPSNVTTVNLPNGLGFGEDDWLGSSQSQQHSPSLPLPLPISFDSTPQPISLPRFSPSSTPPLSLHNPVSFPPSSNTDVPDPLSPKSVASPLPSSPSPSSLSSPPSVPSHLQHASPTHEPLLTLHSPYSASRRTTTMPCPPLNHSSTQSSSRQGTSYVHRTSCSRTKQHLGDGPLPPDTNPLAAGVQDQIPFDGTIERYKARFGCQGLHTVAGIDYQETFSPTAKLTTLRYLLTVAASRNWYIHQLDVHNAFLHGNLQEEVYMTPPPGLRRQGENLVCRLHKSIYGLKQASRNWFSTFTATVKSAGYIQSKADYSLFTKSQGNKFTAILIYVDDILLTGNDLHEIKMLKTHLLKRFFIKDLGELKYFLGIEFSRLKRESLFLKENIWRLIYLIVTRPDIVYSRHTLTHFAIQIRRMSMSRRSVSVIVFSSDHHSSLEIKNKRMFHAHKRSRVRAMANTCSELTWLRYILKYLKVELDKPAPLFCDNQATLYIMANPLFHERTKHIEIDCHIVREKLQVGNSSVLCFYKDAADLGVLDLHSPT